MAMKARMPGGPRGTITALAVMVQTFLPTPQVHDKHGAKTPEQIAEMQDRENCGVRNLNEVAVNELLPTPRASANENRQTKRTPSQEAGDHGLCLAAEMVELLTETGGGLSPDAISEGLEVRTVEHHGPERPAAERGSRGVPWWADDAAWQRPGIFGRYEAAVRQHERAFGRLVPAPVEPNSKGAPRLSPRFSEWMMAIPGGWVTDVPGLSRNAQLTAIGDGVVPAQAAMALRLLLGRAGIPRPVAADWSAA